MVKKSALVILCTSIALLQSCTKQDVVLHQPETNIYSPDVAITWMQTVQQLVQSEG